MNFEWRLADLRTVATAQGWSVATTKYFTTFVQRSSGDTYSVNNLTGEVTDSRGTHRSGGLAFLEGLIHG